jgi:hypothetical protein
LTVGIALDELPFTLGLPNRREEAIESHPPEDSALRKPGQFRGSTYGLSR